ncbi:unnamed protein product [Clonostachys chloroleuca]|uniref:Fungal lipase-type domain-containing protein n=1 Tax=Clonostachys chloroleuca TaxID=1926264 RepID=A0AA35M5Y1_9HYPO|nr:unnamed protein product [Clonostachys chloroleuca]
MWTKKLIAFAALASAIPSEPELKPGLGIERKDALIVTEAELDQMKFFMEQSAASYCNYKQPVGALVRCDREGTIGGSCPSIQNDGVRILWTYIGPVTQVAAYISINHARKQIVFTARGTLTDAETNVNFNFWFKPYPGVDGALVHTGFYDAWDEMATGGAINAISDAVAANPDYSVLATGHSLGGALASMAAASLRDTGLSVDLYTYGAPRLGNAVFNHFLAGLPGADYRVTNLDDPVPRVPFLCWGYRSLSPEYWISQNFTGPDYPPENIKVCEGDANLECNGGTRGLNIFSHGTYFGLSPCLNFNHSKDSEKATNKWLTGLTQLNDEQRPYSSDDLEYCLLLV